MSGGAFRDAGAAIERVAVLEREKDELAAELTTLRAALEEVRGDADAGRDRAVELAKLRAELASERASRKAERRELLPAVTQLEASQKAFFEARGERNAAVSDVTKARDELKQLRAQLADARQRIEQLRGELQSERRRADLAPEPITIVPENLDAYLKRVQDERDDLRDEVRKLREELAAKPKPSLLGSLFGRR